MLRNVMKRSFIHISRASPEISPNSSKMNIAKVRCVPGEERMAISFSYAAQNAKKRVYNFDRVQCENIETTFARISSKVSSIINKKLFKKMKIKQVEEAAEVEGVEQVAVKIYHDSNELMPEVTNMEAWTQGQMLRVGDEQYKIEVNLPTVKSLKLPRNIMVGFPVFPLLELEFASAELCKYKWVTLASEKTKEPGVGNFAEGQCHEGFYFTPSEDDLGKKLSLVCVPSDGERDGDEVEVVSDFCVSNGPGVTPCVKRHTYTKNRAPENSFRIVSYNILADFYADSDYSRDFLYPYCPAQALHIDYRKQLILNEIQGFNADIICLQEVDKKVFVSDLLPWCQTQHLQGINKLKGEVREGTAILFNTKLFSLVSEEDISISETLETDEICADIFDKVNSNSELKEKMSTRNSVLQVVVLARKGSPQDVLIVGNTHLYFHPLAPHVRTLQTIVCVRHLQRLKKKLTDEGFNPTVVFCGDLNSAHSVSGVHTFLREGSVPAKHSDWFAGGKVEHVDGMSFSHDLKLYSTCGYDKITNFVTSFFGCLDYIYTEVGKLETTMVVPLLSHEELTEHVALPSVVCPSDHLPIICDLSWTQTE